MIKSDTLIDRSGTRFIVDKERIYVTAITSSGKLLWKTDPAFDNELPEYKTKRPKIVSFRFRKQQINEVIWIVYSNTQFGYLIKDNGKFQWLGQD